MFRKKDERIQDKSEGVVERVTSVLGDGTNFNGRLTGKGGVRIEGAYEGEVALNGLLVIGTSGRVTCEHVQANTVIVAGALRGNITAEKVEIRSTGRVWGDVKTGTFTTEEGAFLRGKIQMEEHVELDVSNTDTDDISDSEIILQPTPQAQEPAVDAPAKPKIIDQPLKKPPAAKAKAKAKAKPKTSKAKPKPKAAKKTASKTSKKSK
ncbi:MAG: polymer-forming cytoskeletal protein [Chloroflexota bacterium]